MEVTSLKENLSPLSWQSAISHQDPHLAAFPPKNSNFICHEVYNIPHQTNVAPTSSLQNINWLPASKKVWAAYVKEKTSVVTVYIPSPYNGFLYFLEGQVHKDNKLGIMTNVGKSRLAKVIFTNIHKISDACANCFGRYIMIAQSMRNVFTFY